MPGTDNTITLTANELARALTDSTVVKTNTSTAAVHASTGYQAVANDDPNRGFVSTGAIYQLRLDYGAGWASTDNSRWLSACVINNNAENVRIQGSDTGLDFGAGPPVETGIVALGGGLSAMLDSNGYVLVPTAQISQRRYWRVTITKGVGPLYIGELWIGVHRRFRAEHPQIDPFSDGQQNWPFSLASVRWAVEPPNDAFDSYYRQPWRYPRRINSITVEGNVTGRVLKFVGAIEVFMRRYARRPLILIPTKTQPYCYWGTVADNFTITQTADKQIDASRFRLTQPPLHPPVNLAFL